MPEHKPSNARSIRSPVSPHTDAGTPRSAHSLPALTKALAATEATVLFDTRLPWVDFELGPLMAGTFAV